MGGGGGVGVCVSSMYVRMYVVCIGVCGCVGAKPGTTPVVTVPQLDLACIADSRCVLISCILPWAIPPNLTEAGCTEGMPS